MRKLTALLLALLLTLTAATALAGTGIVFSQNPTQETEQVPATEELVFPEDDNAPEVNGVVDYTTYQMDDGLSFILPADWNAYEITEELTSQGIFFRLRDEESGIQIQGHVEKLTESRTPQQQQAAMEADKDTYLSTLLATNTQGADVIAFFHADKCGAGYTILTRDDYAVFFTYTHIDGSAVNNDELLLDLAAEGADAVHIADGETPVPVAPASSGMETTMKNFNGNFHMPVPTGWTEKPLKETDLYRAADPDSEVYFYVRFNQYERALPADGIYSSFSGSENFANVELLTGSNGLKMVKADATDGLFTTVMIPDDIGNVYIITFGMTAGQDKVINNDVMKTLRDIMVQKIYLD